MTWIRIKEFGTRWWKLLAGGLLLVLALDRARRYENRAEKVRERELDSMDEEIAAGWSDINEQSDEVTAALQEAKRIKENAAKRLDGLASVDSRNARIISEWNSDRLSDRT